MALATLPATNKQIPDHSIFDYFNKQTYLGNQFSVNHTFSIGASETVLILLQNSQSGNSQILKALFQNLLTVTSKTSGQSVILNIYSNPTFSNAGTALTPINMRTAYTSSSVAPNNQPIATATYTPTVSANGTLIGSLSSAALTTAQSSLLTVLDNGQNLLITGTASASSTSVAVILNWFEL
jgi:hypothetical protein